MQVPQECRLRVKRVLPEVLAHEAREVAEVIELELSKRLKDLFLEAVVIKITFSDEWPYEVEVEVCAETKYSTRVLSEVVEEAVDKAIKELADRLKKLGLEASG